MASDFSMRGLQVQSIHGDRWVCYIHMCPISKVNVLYICLAQSTDSHHPRILLCKAWILASRKFPRIAQSNLGWYSVLSATE